MGDIQNRSVIASTNGAEDMAALADFLHGIPEEDARFFSASREVANGVHTVVMFPSGMNCYRRPEDAHNVLLQAFVEFLDGGRWRYVIVEYGDYGARGESNREALTGDKPIHPRGECEQLGGLPWKQ